MLIARDKERKLLLDTLDADESKFVAVYGRRRVGKTYLVRQTFAGHLTFQHTGYASKKKSDQLFAFAASLREHGLTDFEPPTSWLEAFELLKELLRYAPSGKKVVFLDELSWMDTRGSDLMVALEGFWNGWASARDDIVLVVCGSATSWMMDKVIHDRGGLHNRLSLQINLKPFTLAECERYAQAQGVALNRHQLLECYMIMGGVAYYWSFLRRDLSLSQNVDAIFFAEDAPLRDEFRHLYSSLFASPDPYVQIIQALGGRRAGLTRGEIIKATGQADSGALTKRLDDLERCGFVRSYHEFGKKRRGAIFQLIDNFTLFHLKFLKSRPADGHFWSNNEGSGSRKAWCGLAFERVCLEHVDQLRRALGINGVLCDVCAWSCKADDERGLFGSQIDLIIARRDQVINLCEMKFSETEYAITKSVDESLRNKAHDFREATGTKSTVHTTIVTTYGLRRNAYANNVQSVVTANDLFAEA